MQKIIENEWIKPTDLNSFNLSLSAGVWALQSDDDSFEVFSCSSTSTDLISEGVDEDDVVFPTSFIHRLRII